MVAARSPPGRELPAAKTITSCGSLREDPNHIVIGTDQGAVITLDCGKSWSSWFNQPTGQFYRVSTDNDFPYRLYAAQQDSGSIVVPNRTDFGLITYRDWFSSGSFESSFIAPDPLNPEFSSTPSAGTATSSGWIATPAKSPPFHRAPELSRQLGNSHHLFSARSSHSLLRLPNSC